MAMPTSFDATQQSLKSLLEEAHDGRIQVPEFQRELSFEDEGIKSLLASVSQSYPIGALTILRAGNPDVRFETRAIAGAPAPTTAPERLLIDGQHRVACLYQVLASGRAVQTKDNHEKPRSRWYYIDIHTALDPDADRDDAVISVPETRQVRTRQGLELDLSTPELEWEQCLFPLHLIFGGNGELRRWQRGFAVHGTPAETEARRELMDRFDAEVVQSFEKYVIPTIVTGKETTRWAVRVHGGPHGPSLSDRFRVSG